MLVGVFILQEIRGFLCISGNFVFVGMIRSSCHRASLSEDKRDMLYTNTVIFRRIFSSSVQLYKLCVQILSISSGYSGDEAYFTVLLFAL